MPSNTKNKKNPFSEFSALTIGTGKTLGAAIKSPSAFPNLEEPLNVSPVKKSKNADRTLKSFHVDNELFKKLGSLKFELGVSYDSLYNEAIKDLLVKYGKL